MLHEEGTAIPPFSTVMPPRNPLLGLPQETPIEGRRDMDRYLRIASIVVALLVLLMFCGPPVHAPGPAQQSNASR